MTGELLNENEAARFLNLSIKCLQNWRWRGTGPRYYRLSNRIRYSLRDLESFVSQCAIEPAAGADEARR